MIPEAISLRMMPWCIRRCTSEKVSHHVGCPTMSSTNQSHRFSWKAERSALQIAVAVACLVPLIAGGYGMIHGFPRDVGAIGNKAISLDSHFRYLSGLLFAIGLCFAASIQRIETHGRRILILTALVVIGGIGRLISLIILGVPSESMLAALGMELIVTPLLALWQARIANRSAARVGTARAELLQ